MPFKDLHVWLIVLNNGVEGNIWEGTDSRIWHKVRPEDGLGLSRTKFANSSHVDPEQMDKRAAC